MKLMKNYYDLKIPEVLYEHLVKKQSKDTVKTNWTGQDFVNVRKNKDEDLLNDERKSAYSITNCFSLEDQRINIIYHHGQEGSIKQNMYKKELDWKFKKEKTPYLTNAWVKAMKMMYEIIFPNTTYDEDMFNVRKLRKDKKIPEYANGLLWSPEITSSINEGVTLNYEGCIRYTDKNNNKVLLKMTTEDYGNDLEVFGLEKLIQKYDADEVYNKKMKKLHKSFEIKKSDFFNAMTDGYVYINAYDNYNLEDNFARKEESSKNYTGYDLCHINPNEARYLYDKDLAWKTKFKKEKLTINKLEELIKKEIKEDLK